MNPLRRAALLIALQFLAVAGRAGAAGPGEIEQQIKAAYLYKFENYVEWPPSFAPADRPLVIGIVGADEIAAELSNLNRGHRANQRAMEVRLLKPGEAPDGVQILFVGRQESGRLKRLLEGIQAQPVLVVTESAGALGAGSIINFVPVDDRIRFEVSLAQAERSGLKISARLLGVAQKVEKP